MRRRLLALCLAALPSLSLAAEGPLLLELSAKGDKVDLGLAAFSAAEGGDLPRARAVREVAKNDLAFPKTFNLIEGGGGSDEADKKSLSSWATLGADLVVTGTVERFLGRTHFTGGLRDVSTGDVVFQKKYPLELGGERALAHDFADDVIRHLTGRPGVSDSRIVFVNDATGKKEVCVVDYDGANFKRLTNDKSIALFPKASPDGKTVSFTTFKDGWPTIHAIGIDGQGRRPLCRYEGLNATAAWLPDGQGLVATLSLGRDPSLHVVDLQGRLVRTLTNAAAVDTAPAPSPDGAQVAFTSDRPGRPQIYVMGANGANLRRLVVMNGWCDSPAWSPEGHLVAFTFSERGKNFDIYTVEAATGRTERLTFGEGDNENASWSPDGRWLVFTSTRRGRPELFIMGADGSHPRPLGDIPGRSFTPDWIKK
jgi:TolB protein